MKLLRAPPLVKMAAGLGIGVVLFAISLFVLRVPLRTIAILFAIGAALLFIWMSIQQRENRQREFEQRSKQACRCEICKHDNAQSCHEVKCKCCLIDTGAGFEHEKGDSLA